uniref:Uncharacterized protein n=1 Tax=Romanomermis culicivorax TaxID=13658 RepID=A0A915J139_ROMCU
MENERYQWPTSPLASYIGGMRNPENCQSDLMAINHQMKDFDLLESPVRHMNDRFSGNYND